MRRRQHRCRRRRRARAGRQLPAQEGLKGGHVRGLERLSAPQAAMHEMQQRRFQLSTLPGRDAGLTHSIRHLLLMISHRALAGPEAADRLLCMPVLLRERHKAGHGCTEAAARGRRSWVGQGVREPWQRVQQPLALREGALATATP